MKLLRFGEVGQEKPGVLDAQGRIRDLSSVVKDIGAEALSPEGLKRIAAANADSLPLVSGKPRLGACVNPGKILCIGLNYVKHAAEGNTPVPKEPVIFMKATSSLSGPNDPIVIPRNSTKTDWEVELGVVIGQRASYVSEKDAPKYIAGYCTTNDVSEREFQIERMGQWTKGKSADSFAPLGPYLVTADHVPNPQALSLYCEINGKRFQNGNTADMVFGVYFLVSYVSQFMSLLPGDILLTGTPDGVGLGMKPNLYLKPGDTVRCGVGDFGEQFHEVVAA